MANLLFRPAELLNELHALRGLAGKFLDQTSPFQLEELIGDIRGLQSGGGAMTLEIPEDRPLRTRVSTGEFEPATKSCGREVFGEVTGIWEVVGGKYKVPDRERPNKKPTEVMLIGFSGIASTVFRVFDKSTGDTVACWKMELGDASAPGCFFHTFASLDHAFPVPRHPNMFATPMSAIGFALGELFQDVWEEAVSGTTDPPNRWRSIQTKRVKALLEWQLEQVSNTDSSPWYALKQAKPDNRLFLC
jgi:hypothetical protein